MKKGNNVDILHGLCGILLFYIKKQGVKRRGRTARDASPGADPKKDQYFYCQSVVRSTQGLFALYLSGWPLEKLHNYDSSWIGWSKDTDLPLEAGLPTDGSLKHAKR